MNIRSMFSQIIGYVIIIVTLALAPTIQTQNALVQAANLTNCIGLAALDDFGAPLIILGLLVSGGLFVVAGARGANKGMTMKQMIGVVGAVVVIIVGLTFLVSIIGYVNTLIGADATQFEDTIWGIIPLIIYLGIIAASGFGGYTAYKQIRGKKKSRVSSGY